MYKLLLLFIGLVFSIQVFSQTIGDTVISNSQQNLKVKVLYFHITNRCHTCNSIETNVRKAIFTYFQSALDSGNIALSIMNCELPENAEMAKKYSAYGATLAITTYKDGQELTSEDISTWAFQKVHDSNVFISELKSKLDLLLK